MTKYKWTKKEKELVGRLLKKYKQKLNLESWTINTFFLDGAATVGHKNSGPTFIAFAENTITHAYEKIEITLFPALLKEYRENTRFELEDTIKHELVHCLTQELYELSYNRFVSEKECQDAVERLTQRISKLI